MAKISRKEMLMGRDVTHASEFTPEISANIDELVDTVNKFFTELEIALNTKLPPVRVSSGWRPTSINSKVKGAAPKSTHQLGLGVDIVDDGFWDELLQTPEAEILKYKYGLFQEDPSATPTWCHIDKSKTRKPRHPMIFKV